MQMKMKRMLLLGGLLSLNSLCGIAAAVLVAAGIAAFQSYGSYGTQDNSLLMQNVEALAQGPDGGDGDSGDDNTGSRKFIAKKCYMSEADKGSSGYICPEGTGRDVFTDCPNETKTVELYSLSGFCLRELSN